MDIEPPTKTTHGRRWAGLGLILAFAALPGCSTDPDATPEDCDGASCGTTGEAGSTGTPTASENSADGASSSTSTGGPSDNGEETETQPTTTTPTGDTDDGESTGESLPCNPLVDGACVACGGASCSDEACCWVDTPSCGEADGCLAPALSSCDGAEDCIGGVCCAEATVDFDRAVVTYGAATCGLSIYNECCDATPGTAGCAAEPATEQCVCSASPECCSGEWNDSCANYVEILGCGLCAELGCPVVVDGTTVGEWNLAGPACHSNADCVLVSGGFVYDYDTCCRGDGFDVGVCVDSATASDIVSAGGACG